MKNLYITILFSILACSFSACHDEPDYKDTLTGNFDALADIMDRHYCFFSDKDIDWQEVTGKYRALIEPETSMIELFFICSQMLDELRDGHVNLSSRFSSSYYRNWWSDYPQDFNLRTI